MKGSDRPKKVRQKKLARTGSRYIINVKSEGGTVEVGEEG